ncbi:MAG: hypothetical protein ACPK85_01460 [Methanosarcina sp.]
MKFESYIRYCARLRFHPPPVRTDKSVLPRKGTSRLRLPTPIVKKSHLAG